MNLLTHGENISAVEVSSILRHGIWLFVHGKKLFLSYTDFPWFRDHMVKLILNVEEQSPGHYYWPDLDVDLTEEIIEHPERFPLV